jgi:predicted nucleic acid-binding protein
LSGVLIDTSVWLAHFRSANEGLIHLIETDMAMTHSMILLEIACGTPPHPRSETLASLEVLELAKQATLEEARTLVEREKLYGVGCGLVDIVLLTSTLITPAAKLWTFDKKLNALAQRFGVAYGPILQH